MGKVVIVTKNFTFIAKKCTLSFIFLPSKIEQDVSRLFTHPLYWEPKLGHNVVTRARILIDDKKLNGLCINLNYKKVPREMLLVILVGNVDVNSPWLTLLERQIAVVGDSLRARNTPQLFITAFDTSCGDESSKITASASQMLHCLTDLPAFRSVSGPS